MKKTICSKCGATSFSLFRSRDCSECQYNGVHEEDEGYTHPLHTEEERTQVVDECECLKGSSAGEGCVIITCKCGAEIERCFFF